MGTFLTKHTWQIELDIASYNAKENLKSTNRHKLHEYTLSANSQCKQWLNE